MSHNAWLYRRIASRFVAVAALALCFMSAACQPEPEVGPPAQLDDGEPPQAEDDRPVEEVLALIDEMPDWASTASGDEDVVERIDSAARRIAAYPTATIRAAFVQCREDVGGQSAYERKLYVLNQFLFDLPRTVRRDSPHFSATGGPWLGAPVSGAERDPQPSDEADMRWPWAADAEGVWRLTGRFFGYFGASYNYLRAFDYYSANFGRREIPAARPQRPGD